MSHRVPLPATVPGQVRGGEGRRGEGGGGEEREGGERGWGGEGREGGEGEGRGRGERLLFLLVSGPLSGNIGAVLSHSLSHHSGWR